MKDPAYALQKAVRGLIVGTGTVADRAYERPPQNALKPFCQIGDDTIFSDNEAGEFHDCTAVVNIVATTKAQAKEIGGTLRAILEQRIAIEGFMTVEYEMASASYSIESDGLTGRAILEFRYLLQTVE